MADNPITRPRPARCKIENGELFIYSEEHGEDTELLFQHISQASVEQHKKLKTLLTGIAANQGALDRLEIMFYGTNMFDFRGRDPDKAAITFIWDSSFAYEIKLSGPRRPMRPESF